VPDLDLTIQNEQDCTIDLQGTDELAQLVWSTEAKKPGEITIILVDDEQLSKINIEFLTKDYKTDVIAFPLSDGGDEIFEGEIYISVARVIENAGIYKVAPSHELRRVIIHALLHFLGYSDKEIPLKQKMTNRENFYLDFLFNNINKI